MPKGKRYHITTRIEKDDDGWWCVCDVGDVIAGKPHEAMLEDVLSVREGPWPSRQVARKELRGKFRESVVGAVQKFTKKYGGHFERFEV